MSPETRDRMRIGRSRSSKVVDLGTNRKGVCDFLLVINSNFGPIWHRFCRCGDLLAENCEFFLPHSFDALTRGEPSRISGSTFYPENQSSWAIRW